MKTHIPNLTLVEYVGKLPRKLWEVKGVEKPLLEKGDRVLLSKTEAVLLVRSKGRDFKICEDQEVSSGQNNQKPPVIQTKDLTDEYTLPLIEDIETLTEDEIKAACDFVGIKKGNKPAKNLIPMLMPHLKTKE